MNKCMMRILSIALLLCLLFCLTACGTSGHYVLTEMAHGGVNVSAEDAGYEQSYLEMNSDGTAVLCLDGELINLSWQDEQIWATGEERTKASFEVRGSVLTLNVEGIELIFEKD